MRRLHAARDATRRTLLWLKTIPVCCSLGNVAVYRLKGRVSRRAARQRRLQYIELFPFCKQFGR